MVSEGVHSYSRHRSDKSMWRCKVPDLDRLCSDISVVKEYNRCAYVLETLAVTHKNWKKCKNAPFTEPISLLMV